MTTHLRTFVDQLRQLALSTGRAWWATLPRLLTAVLAGWLGYRLLTQLAALVLDNAWLALALMALAFVAQLSALVVCLRILGEALRVRESLPLAHEDRRDSSLSHLLALTLLPFLGIYAAFDKVTEATNQLQVAYFLHYGLSFDNPLLDQLSPNRGGGSVGVILSLIASLYLIRRGLDFWFERREWRPIGIASALVEAFFLFVLVVSGRLLVIDLGRWLDERVFLQWLDTAKAALTAWARGFGVDLSEAFDAVSWFIGEALVPGLATALLQPMLWLAVAGLVYGTQVLSVADLWRRGTAAPVSSRSRVRVGSGSRAAVLQVQEAFFGDLNDKYLPTFQSLRLVVSAGATFLGAYVLAYGLLDLARQGFLILIQRVIGGGSIGFWVAVDAPMSLVETLIFESLRLALLAAAFQLCLRLVEQVRSGPQVVEATAGAA